MGLGLKAYAYIAAFFGLLWAAAQLIAFGQAKEQNKSLKKDLEDIESAKSIREDIESISDDDVLAQLRRNGWIRDDDKQP